ncbi:MAG: TorF family putative porin [Thermodesulfobacteriota bacterium]
MRKTMMNLSRMILAASLCSVLTSGLASAEEETPSADLGVSILSDYVWRGYGLSDGSLVVQPSMTVSYKGFAVNMWGNLDTDYNDDGADLMETDLTVSYDGAAGIVGYGLGYIFYGLDGDDSQELYASAGLDVLLAPTLTVYRDFDAFDGWYATLGISHSIALADDLTLDLGAQAGYYSLDDVDYDELHDGLLSVSLTYGFAEYFSLTPEIHYSFPLTSESEADIEAVSVSGDSDYLYGGLTLGMAF